MVQVYKINNNFVVELSELHGKENKSVPSLTPIEESSVSYLNIQKIEPNKKGMNIPNVFLIPYSQKCANAISNSSKRDDTACFGCFKVATISYDFIILKNAVAQKIQKVSSFILENKEGKKELVNRRGVLIFKVRKDLNAFLDNFSVKLKNTTLKIADVSQFYNGIEVKPHPKMWTPDRLEKLKDKFEQEQKRKIDRGNEGLVIAICMGIFISCIKMFAVIWQKKPHIE